MNIPNLSYLLALFAAMVLSACSSPVGGIFQPKQPDVAVNAPSEADIRPKLRPDAAVTQDTPLTPETATNVTDADIAKATKPIERPEQDKGLTIASLGLLDQDGFWLATPLVTSEAMGRVVVEETGASVNVTLRPNGAAAGSGSQLSLAAMQVLGLQITDLTTVRVFIR